MSFRGPIVAGLLAVSAASCSRRLGDPEGSAPGEAAEALAATCCITDVQADPITYHFDSPRWVLDAAEGLGPRVLALTVAGFAAPLVTTTVASHPKDTDVSTAVGYSVDDFYYLQASAAYNVDSGRYKRLEAYVDYARAAWVIRDAGCGAVLGSGVSFKPIGVYFAAHETASVAIPATSVIGVLPDGAGGPCGYAPDPDPPSSDAGTGGAGPGDAGPGDAGPGDGGDR